MRRTISLSGVALLVGLSSICTPISVSYAQGAPPAESILVFPFTAPSGAKDEWIGKAVQQDLLADLTQGATIRVLAPTSVPAAADSRLALQAGREQGASFVVFGQAQLTEHEVRLTGQVLDVNSGQPLGALKATGPSDELFHLEDALSGQVFLALPKTLLTAQTVEGMQQAGSKSTQQAVTPAQVPAPSNVYTVPNDVNATEVYPPPASYSYPSYTYNYYQTPDVTPYYPAYTYGYPGVGGWPYWDSGFIGGFGLGFGGRFHDDDDFGHHWGDRGERGNFNNNGNGGRGFASTGRGFAGAGNRFGNAGANQFSPVQSGFGSTGYSRMGAAPRISSGGFHAGASRGGSFGGFHAGAARGGSFGGSRGGSGGFHGGGGGGHGGGGHR